MCNMNDEWIRWRAALGLKHPRHRRRVERIRAETVHGFGWKRHQASFSKGLCGAAKFGFGYQQN
jgi:hypothetical protein